MKSLKEMEHFLFYLIFIFIWLARIVEVSDEPLRRVIKQLGGWPVADPTWDPDNTLPLEQLIAILKRNFTLGVIIEEWVGPDDRNSLGHVIQVISSWRQKEKIWNLKSSSMSNSWMNSDIDSCVTCNEQMQ